MTLGVMGGVPAAHRDTVALLVSRDDVITPADEIAGEPGLRHLARALAGGPASEFHVLSTRHLVFEDSGPQPQSSVAAGPGWDAMLKSACAGAGREGLVWVIRGSAPLLPSGVADTLRARGASGAGAWAGCSQSDPLAIVCPSDRIAQCAEKIRALDPQDADCLARVLDVLAASGLELARVGDARSNPEFTALTSFVTLARVEKLLLRRRTREAMDAGLRMDDPRRTELWGTLVFGTGCRVGSNVAFKGDVRLGNNVTVASNVILRDCVIGDDTHVREFSVVEQASVGRACRIGPFARVRPDSELGDRVQIGNFVEVKSCQLADGVLINHLSFVGDATVGRGVILGAGTITCNFDGRARNRTIIDEEAFVGSGAELVAPVHIGSGAKIGAGSTITEDVPAGRLSIARARQVLIQKR
jgi:acetyltransferase-like isoleucine patch superfamily enzyme